LGQFSQTFFLLVTAQPLQVCAILPDQHRLTDDSIRPQSINNTLIAQATVAPTQAASRQATLASVA